jgi:hypothetical protein
VLYCISSLDFSPALKCRVICFSQQIFHSRIGSLSLLGLFWRLAISRSRAPAGVGFLCALACFLHNNSIGSGTVPVICFASWIQFFHGLTCSGPTQDSSFDSIFSRLAGFHVQLHFCLPENRCVLSIPLLDLLLSQSS